MSKQQEEIWESLQKMRVEIENHTDLGWMLEAIDRVIAYIGRLESSQKPEEENKK